MEAEIDQEQPDEEQTADVSRVCLIINQIDIMNVDDDSESLKL